MMSRNLDTQENIRKAAKHLFAKKGYNATSTREIVSEAGANISAIAYHFGGKEGLFLSLFDDFLQQGNAAAGSFKDPVSELRYLLSRIIRLRFEDPELVTILQQEIVVHSERSEAIKERLVPIWQRIRFLLEKGNKGGDFEFRSSYNALNFAMSVAVFPRQNPFFRDVVDKSESEEAVTDEMISFILRGLGWKNRG
jgi:AcrR family transcriptional regulator